VPGLRKEELQDYPLITNNSVTAVPIRVACNENARCSGRCGLHRKYYSGIERDVRNVSLVNIERIGKGLKTGLPGLFKRV
jgi:hypothetical protein